MKLQELITASVEADDPFDWLEFLKTEYFIEARIDESAGLVSLKYNQIESPMHLPVVQECRGVVVDLVTNRVVAWGYNKFWNLGDHLADTVDWKTARCLEKLDGSIMQLFYHPREDCWRVASSGTPTASGSFGSATVSFANAFWEHFETLGMQTPAFTDRDTTFMFELCDAPNRVVVRHDRPRIVLHGARSTAGGYEYGLDDLQLFGKYYNWEVVKSYPITTPEDCLVAAAALDPVACEGFVVVDASFNRVKIKSPRYVALHHLRGDATPRRVIELWRTGECSELLLHFPEMAGEITPIHAALDRIAYFAAEAWWQHHKKPRKEFAAAVKSLPWSSVCFRLFGDSEASEVRALAIMRGFSIQALERLVESVMNAEARGVAGTWECSDG